jgi:hypothetical protein
MPFLVFTDQKVNGFGPAHIEKSHFKGIFGYIFRQSLMKYGENKSIKENCLRPCVLIPEDNRYSTVTRKIPLFSVEPVTISLHALLSSLIFTCQIKLASLILFTTLVYTSTLKSTVKKIFQIFVILIKK